MLEVLDADSGDEFTLVGPVGHLNAGDRAEVSGEWQEHTSYGPQLQAAAPCRSTPPTARARSPT